MIGSAIEAKVTREQIEKMEARLLDLKENPQEHWAVKGEEEALAEVVAELKRELEEWREQEGSTEL